MKTTRLSRRASRRHAATAAKWVLGAAMATLQAQAADAPAKTEKDYRNWFDVSVGVNSVDGNDAAFKRRHGVPQGAQGGISDFHYEQDVGKKGIFEVDGRGIFDNHDYSLRLNLSDPDVGYVRAGYKEFRSYYDGSAGLYPGNQQWLTPYDDSLFVDRGEAFFEAGLNLADKPSFRLRYARQFREGDKNSTSWGDSNLTGGAGTRAIVPTFLRLDEERHSIELDVKHTIANTGVGAGIRYEFSSTDNGRYIRRTPGEATDRFLTHREGMDTDLLSVRTWTDTQLHPIVRLTTGYSFTTMDTDSSGTRIYGSAYDASFLGDALALRYRQSRDHGYTNVTGGSQVHQHVANINLVLKPWDHFQIVPALRVEAQDQEGSVTVADAEVGTTAARRVGVEHVLNSRERGLLDITESIEARYTGVTNWVFHARGEWLQGDGDLKESETLIDDGKIPIFRDTESTRFAQKYAAGANWYPTRRVNMAAQYYHKTRANDYDHRLDSAVTLPTPPAYSNGDLYPAQIRRQDFETDDVNFRITLRPVNNLTLISRYDFQLNSIETGVKQVTAAVPASGMVESSEGTAHIFSETITWSPWTRWYLQGAGSYTFDEMETPAVFTGGAAAGRAQKSKNSYWTASGSTGFVVDEKTDWQAQYSYYRADNWEPTLLTQPLGAGTEEHGVSTAIIRRLTQWMQVTLRYGFFTLHDQASGGRNDYEAHMVSSTFRFRF